MKRGALETVGSPGMDRAAGDEKRAKAGASTATATPHRRGTLLAGAGEEQENLDPAGPIRERIASETGDPARADSDGPPPTTTTRPSRTRRLRSASPPRGITISAR